jgi:hypothetical protein
MVASIPYIYLLLISSWIEFSCVIVIPIWTYVNFAAFSKDLLAVYLYYDFVLHSGDKSTSLLASVFLFMLFMFPPNKLWSPPSSQTRTWCDPFDLNLYLSSWTFLMAYSKAKWKSNSDKAFPYFRRFWTGNALDRCFPCYLKFQQFKF